MDPRANQLYLPTDVGVLIPKDDSLRLPAFVLASQNRLFLHFFYSPAPAALVFVRLLWTRVLYQPAH
ncbi:MAG: hypothetical protein LBP29_00375 [Treponema sp.]|jgi:hypothetical protein|nr:hypothetical protein [Treponema sp.]